MCVISPIVENAWRGPDGVFPHPYPLSTALTALSLVLAVGLSLFSSKVFKSTLSLWALLLIALGVLISAATSAPKSDQYPDLWSGYGKFPVLTAIILGLMYLMPPSAKLSGQLWTRLMTGISLLTVALYAPTFIQPPTGLLNLGDTTYHVLDELLAPAMGAIPYGNYSPTYSGLWGWIVYPIFFLPISASSKMLVLIWVCNLFFLLMPLLATLTIKILFPGSRSPMILAVYAVVTCASGSFNGSSTLLAQFSTFTRGLPVLVVIYLTCAMVIAKKSKQKNVLAVACGTSIAFAVLANPDRGLLVCAFVLCLIITVTKRGKLRVQDLSLVVASCFAAIIAYLAVLLNQPSGFNYRSIAGLRLNTNNIYAFTPIEWRGAHIIFIALAITGLAVHGKSILTAIERIDYARAIFGASSSMWLLVSLSKWYLRAIPQATIELFIPGFLVGASLVVPWLGEKRCASTRSRFMELPLTFLLFLSIGAIWQMPNPLDELRRITNDHSGSTNWSSTPGRPADGYSNSSLKIYDNFITTIPNIAHDLDSTKQQVGYFGIFGHTVELLTGIDNLLGISAPESLSFGGARQELACIPSLEKHRRFVIVYRSDFPCDGYSLNVGLSRKPFLVFVSREVTTNSIK